MDIQQFKTLPVMGILRGIAFEDVEPLVEAVVSAGLKTIEITMNTEAAPALIEEMVKAAKGRLTIGAGTVLSLENLQEALKAGATFIVSPTLIPDVVKFCVENKIPVFPGALTPQEIYNAGEAGATMVKVFPAKFFGPTYFKEVRGPFKDIELMACGGVTADTVDAFFYCGAAAVAFGGSVFKKEWLAAKGFKKIERSVHGLVERVKKAQQT